MVRKGEVLTVDHEVIRRGGSKLCVSIFCVNWQATEQRIEIPNHEKSHKQVGTIFPVLGSRGLPSRICENPNCFGCIEKAVIPYHQPTGFIAILYIIYI